MTKRKKSNKRDLTAAMLLFTAVCIAFAGDYYHLYRNGAEIAQIAGERVDSVKVEGGMIRFYEREAMVWSGAVTGIDSLTVSDVSTVQLLLPAQDASVDLNQVDSLAFAYIPAPGVEKYVLTLSRNQDLSEAVNIPLGNVRKRTFHADDLYGCLLAIGVDYAATPVYWSVAPIDADEEDKAAAPQKLTLRKRHKGRLLTVTGDGVQAFRPGTLAEGRIRARALCVDANNNIFAFMRDNDVAVMALASEAGDTLAQKDSGILIEACDINRSTGVVYAVGDGHAGRYFTYEPARNYVRRELVYSTAGLNVSGNGRGVAYNPHDDHVYLKYSGGPLIKVNAKKSSSVAQVSAVMGDCRAMAFHPLEPDMLYYTFNGSVYRLDVSKGLNDADALEEIVDSSAGLNTVTGICFDGMGNAYLTERYTHHAVWMLTSDHALIRVIGHLNGSFEGARDGARLSGPSSVGVGSDGSLYIAEWGTACIRKYLPSAGVYGDLLQSTVVSGVGDSIAVSWENPQGVEAVLELQCTQNGSVRTVSVNAHSSGTKKIGGWAKPYTPLRVGVSVKGGEGLMQCHAAREFTVTPLNGKATAAIRAGSYNVLYANQNMDSSDSVSWVNRKWRLFTVLDECNFDIVGTQEPEFEQPEDISNHYNLRLVRHSRLFYRPDRFRKLDSGCFWLSGTPEIQSGWEIGRDCYSDWVKFMDKASGIVFYYFNVHFDASSEYARDRSAVLMLNRLQAQAGNTPLFISGDFNSKRPSQAMVTMRQAFQDVFDMAESVNRGSTERTYNHLTTDLGSWIDYIYVNTGSNRRFTVHSAAVNDRVFETKSPAGEVVNTQFASDHFPIVSEVTIR
jgi:endonuclease/exonuclease/phosphatase family metal-dependent hydrolase